jgi:cyclophilin family peptidyl-prolyl cis-trans isomerase
MGKKAQIRRTKKEETEKSRKEILREISRLKNPWENFWRRLDFWIYTLCLVALIAFPFVKKDSLITTEGNMAIIHTSKGDIEIAFYPESAPKTVENFKALSEKGYYDNLAWHRVIKGFMIQGGDPKGDGTGGESSFGDTFDDEINPKSLGLSDDQIKKLEDQGYKYNYKLTSHKMDVGSLAMANSGPNTNGSQFFIVTEQAQPHLDGQHTVFGHVIKGLDVAVAISEVPVDESDKPIDPVNITSVELK